VNPEPACELQHLVDVLTAERFTKHEREPAPTDDDNDAACAERVRMLATLEEQQYHVMPGVRRPFGREA
jgi:hypothetical protein